MGRRGEPRSPRRRRDGRPPGRPRVRRPRRRRPLRREAGSAPPSSELLLGFACGAPSRLILRRRRLGSRRGLGGLVADDLTPGVGAAGGADPMRQARAVAARAFVQPRRRGLVLRAPLVAPRPGLSLLGDRHWRVMVAVTRRRCSWPANLTIRSLIQLEISQLAHPRIARLLVAGRPRGGGLQRFAPDPAEGPANRAAEGPPGGRPGKGGGSPPGGARGYPRG